MPGWTTPVDWLAKPVSYKVTRADLQTISDDLAAIALPIGIDLQAPGWVAAPETWVYASATLFKVLGVDVSSRYPVGTKLSCVSAPGNPVQYFHVVSATFTADTLITVTGGSKYALPATIVLPRYSYATNPFGFPGSFLYTSTQGGWLGTPTESCYFAINGGELTARLYCDGSSTTGATTLTLPIAVSDLFPSSSIYQPCMVIDNSGAATLGCVAISRSSATLTFYRDMARTAFTTSGGKQVCATITVPI
jgi:hypothetical protein